MNLATVTSGRGRGGRGRGGGGRGDRGRGRGGTDQSEGKNYLQSAIRHKNHVFNMNESGRLVNIIVASDAKIICDLTDTRNHGLKLIENILKRCDRNSAKEIIIPLLGFLMAEESSLPVYRAPRDTLLRMVCNFNPLMRELVEFVNMPCGDESGDCLSKFLSICIQGNMELLRSEDVKMLADALHAQQAPRSELVYNILRRSSDDRAKISAQFAASTAAAAAATHLPPPVPAALKRPPGGRHDNDQLQFREIAVLPTVQELLCTEAEYLPLANGSNRFIADPTESFLDSLFRLVRQNSIQPFKEVNLSTIDGSSSGGLRCKCYKGCRFDYVHCEQNQAASVVVAVDCPPHLAGASKNDVEFFWKNRSMANYNNVAALRRDGQLVCFATVSVADLPWLTHDPPRLGLSFSTGTDLEQFLCNFISRDGAGCSIVLFASDLSTDANTMRALQHMQEVPMAQHIVPFWRPPAPVRRRGLFDDPQAIGGIGQLNLAARQPQAAAAVTEPPPAYLPATIRIPGCAAQLPETLSAEFIPALVEHTTLDQSQARAVHAALTKPVALIQGPPGTGKTYIGSMLAQIILNCSEAKIVCLCYTNHALDQFLEYLLDAGVEGIVRVGARTKSERVANCNLSLLASKLGKDSSRATKSRLAQTYEEMTGLREQIAELEQSVVLVDHPENTPWEVVHDYLIYHDRQALRQLSMPEVEDGFQFGKQQMNRKDYLWNQWIKGQRLPVVFARQANGPLWSMLPDQRRASTIEWLREYLGRQRSQLHRAIVQYNEARANLEGLWQESKRCVLSSARVIGATTSGATTHKALLAAAGAQVVMVEEAGEVLEAHIVTSMCESTEHLILIGDHKQLRPKINDYTLKCVSRKGFDMDKSTFERLVVNCAVEPATLSEQRRMAPEIADLIRPTYPELTDHLSVTEHPAVKGISKNVLFVDHSHRETGGGANSSGGYENLHEVKMVVATTRLLMLNGYKAAQLVILTPYLGQLLSIQREVRKELKEVIALVSDIDKAELLRQGILSDDEESDSEEDGTGAAAAAGGTARTRSRPPAPPPEQVLRTATVDNFQGEEADVVIMSLVRSNSDGNVGFLKEPERVNVLLSRARHGMLMFGSARTLRSSKKASPVWSPVLDKLEARGCLVDGIPSYCQLHPHDTVVLQSAEQIRALRPNGGCQRQCTYRMACGHACTQSCHAVDRAHEHIKCDKPCERVPSDCPSRHSCPKRCYEDCGSCRTQVPTCLPCGHSRPFACGIVNDPIRHQTIACLMRGPVELPCGHTITVGCSKLKLPRADFVCTEQCPQKLECGHPCRHQCGTCRREGSHSACKELCGRTLVCGHSCKKQCHGTSPCPPCTQPCGLKCDHSKCPKECKEVCSSCMEDCEWTCEHRGACTKHCGAPCLRLPCDLRCSKVLKCGHRCPTVCGEVCPPSGFCQVKGCTNGSKRALEQVADLVMMERYAEVDLDDDPVCLLECGHIFTISTLDGIIEMTGYYKRDGNGQWEAPVPLKQKQTPKPSTCPQCKAVVRGARRYGRPLQHAQLAALERKFQLFNTNELAKLALVQDKKTRVRMVLAHYQTVATSSPTQKLFDACAARGGEVEVPRPPLLPRLEAADLLAKTLLDFDDADSVSTAVRVRGEHILHSCIAMADEEKFLKRGVQLRLQYVATVHRLNRNTKVLNELELKQRMKNMTDWVIDHSSEEVSKEDRQQAVQLKKVISTDKLSKEEMDAVIQAMGGPDAHGRGVVGWGHWYECPNGHPYYIGECGGAMEESKCPECGVVIGGQNHMLTDGNRNANFAQANDPA